MEYNDKLKLANMTIEEKAKAYDEAKDRMSRAFNDNRCTIGFMNEIFPELKESEDERIRKEIIIYLKSILSNKKYVDKFIESWIDWLEKQGKNNMGISETTKQKLEDNLNKALEKETPESCNEFLEKQYSQILANSAKTCKDEQKPAWSEEDEENLNWFEKFFRAESVIAKGKDIPQDKYLWFKSLKERVQPQPKQEWSEEDESIINDIEESLIAYKIIVMDNDMELANYIEKDIEWLKSLKDRYTWKPSDEQMDAINDAIDYLGGNTKIVRKHLMSLYEQLKKLKA